MRANERMSANNEGLLVGLAIALGFCCLVVILVIVVVVVVAVASLPPPLPCDFSATVAESYTISATGVTHVSDMSMYSVKFNNVVHYALHSTQNLNTSGSRWSKGSVVGTAFTNLFSFFNRSVCMRTTSQDAASCPLAIYPTSSHLNSLVPCPSDASKNCDVYTVRDSKTGYNETWYLLPKVDEKQKVRVPSALLMIDSAGSDLWVFRAFNESGAPSPTSAAFNFVPPSQTCLDMGESGRKRSSQMGSGVRRMMTTRDLADAGKNEVRMVNEGGARRHATWVEGPSRAMEGVTMGEWKKRLMPTPTPWRHSAGPSLTGMEELFDGPQQRRIRDARDVRAVPISFDARTNWTGCDSIKEVRNQGKCGSCWTFATAEALADRHCIVHGTNVRLSTQHLMDCFGTNGCEGGSTDVALKYLIQNGTVTESCRPYKEVPSVCSVSSCADGSTPAFFRASSAYTLYVPFSPSATAALMQNDIMTYGPLSIVFLVFEDFSKYSQGVYVHSSTSKYSGLHAVKIIGWGVSGGEAYWTVANSWGSSWGENGFFRIRRGTNECGIEEMVAAGAAA